MNKLKDILIEAGVYDKVLSTIHKMASGLSKKQQYPVSPHFDKNGDVQIYRISGNDIIRGMNIVKNIIESDSWYLPFTVAEDDIEYIDKAYTYVNDRTDTDLYNYAIYVSHGKNDYEVSMDEIRVKLVLTSVLFHIYSCMPAVNFDEFYVPDGWKSSDTNPADKCDSTDTLFDDDYCREISNAYWAEEEEMKAGIHPTQVLERIKKTMADLFNITDPNITFLNWEKYDGPRVEVSTDDMIFGVFNYETNAFEEMNKREADVEHMTTAHKVELVEYHGLSCFQNKVKELFWKEYNDKVMEIMEYPNFCYFIHEGNSEEISSYALNTKYLNDESINGGNFFDGGVEPPADGSVYITSYSILIHYMIRDGQKR